MQSLIDTVNRFSNGVYDAVLAPLGPLGDGAQLVAVSVVLGVAVTLLFKVLLDKPRLESARNDLRASLFEIWLYRHEPGVVLRAEWELVRANGRYVGALFPPLCVAMLVVSPLLVQSFHRFGLEPIAPGSEVLLTAQLAVGAATGDAVTAPPELEWTSGRGEVTATVRKPSVDQLVWRLRPHEAGIHTLRLSRGAQAETMPLHVGSTHGESVVQARETSPWRLLVQPRGAALASGSGLERVTLEYPEADTTWLVWLTVVSLLATLITNRFVSGRST